MMPVRLLVYTLAALFTSALLSGQNIPNYDFYVGTWVYETPSEQFIMKTKKTDYVFYGKTVYILIATYRYVKNGVTIYDDLNTLSTTNKQMVNIWLYSVGDLPSNQVPTRLILQMNDHIKRKQVDGLFIELVSVSPPKIKWKLKEVEWSQEGDELPGFSVPEEMILTKVE